MPNNIGVNLRGARLEQEHVPAVLERRHVLVQRLPVVRDDHDAGLRRELARDALALEAPGVEVPGHGLFLFGLAETLEEPHARAIGVEGIDVVDHDKLIAVPVELGVHAKRGGVALDPARLAVAEHRAHGAALGQPPGADQDHEMEVPLGEGPQVLVQPFVGRKPQHLVGGL